MSAGRAPTPSPSESSPSEADLQWLRRCLELAAAARDAGDGPFGSVLVDGDGRLVAEARNTVNTDNDITAHPELKLARLAAAELSPRRRAEATVYTSGEHCPMCAVAHAASGVGRLVFALSAAELAAQTGQHGWDLPVRDLFARRHLDVEVVGPAPELYEAAVALHRSG